ncbi:excisionase [Bradyrhizobium sp. CCBAU 51765]|uniref:excisionase n=1 Tax=Bradyrhizobium sp. CCBAU 51765 TaxID=1325102 RepID=UPI001886F242|nr:excisionase [Bradyrhizobium sp. CCBAU 51765]QOZ09246.1 excisionase [Bradyrhizobium sp. CCBAU 51765]
MKSKSRLNGHFETERDAISPETPLRLAIAAEVAFPQGGMTASGLRKEAARGRLMIERIAGKDYTTLAAIAKMRELCRIPAASEVNSSEALESAASKLEAFRKRLESRPPWPRK